MLDSFPAKAVAMTFPTKAVMRSVQRNWEALRPSWDFWTMVAELRSFEVGKEL